MVSMGVPAMIPSGYVKIAIENDPVEIVDFPIKSGGSFQFAMSVCLKIGYIPNYSNLIGIMIINHWV